ncbi:MAG TPA: T9SS type A sorting domain-containing protein [Bacteroidota bacterium]|nr:T9SS type A sorting domain-containing protein [Bacteroidota bacterium]
MNRSRVVLSGLGLLMLACAVLRGQTTYFVNASAGNDGNAGTSSGTAFKTITHALSVAANTDVVNVAAGTYTVALGESFPLTMVSGVTLTGTAGAATTIIDATGSLNRVFDCNSNSSTTIIQGFTITGGRFTASSNGSNSFGGGIYVHNGSQTIIQQNIITKDTARGYDFYEVTNGHNGGNSYGGGIYISGAAPTIRNNIISYNVAMGGGGEDFRGGFSGTPSAGGFADGGGIHAAFGNASTFVNNTFYGNKAVGGPGGATNNGIDPGGNGGNASAGGLDLGFNAIARNNIFSNNAAVKGTHGGGNGGSDGTETDGALTNGVAGNSSYNLYYNNAATTNPDGGTLGTNNVMADPLFVSSVNYHFTNTSSPAYHVGTSTGAPAADFDGTTRGNPPSIGAFEGVDPLPVEMASFTATANSRSALLRWNTATEENNYGFDIERRQNQLWTRLGFVAGFGSSASPREYVYEDKNLSPGHYSYRIKQINLDGSFKYTPGLEVTIRDVPSSFWLEQNYPNPFNPTTTISYQLAAVSTVTLKVYDLPGRELATLVDGEMSAGTHEVAFDATKFASGVYFYRIQAGTFTATKKLILVK